MKTIMGSLLITLLLFFTACDKAETEQQSLNGNYIGLFNRTGMDTARVTLIFTGNRFEGYSDMAKYPAICKGEFDLGYNTIRFDDACSWTADFDWSLILSGEYHISFDEGTVRIWKTNGNITDEYLLRRPVR